MGKSAGNIRVVVADDHPVVAAGVAGCLADHAFDVCCVVAGARSLASAVESHSPGLVVIGTITNDSDELCAAVADVVVRFSAPVLVFTSDISPEAVHAALDCGCQGVVPRTAAVEEFVAAARAVAAGHRHVDPAALAGLFDWIHNAKPDPDSVALSARELDVLALIADGFTNQRIAGVLGISPGTVKTHVENLLHKLGASDRAHAVSRAMRLGVLS